MALLPPPKGNGFLCHKNFMKNMTDLFKHLNVPDTHYNAANLIDFVSKNLGTIVQKADHPTLQELIEMIVVGMQGVALVILTQVDSSHPVHKAVITETKWMTRSDCTGIAGLFKKSIMEVSNETVEDETEDFYLTIKNLFLPAIRNLENIRKHRILMTEAMGLPEDSGYKVIAAIDTHKLPEAGMPWDLSRMEGFIRDMETLEAMLCTQS